MMHESMIQYLNQSNTNEMATRINVVEESNLEERELIFSDRRKERLLGKLIDPRQMNLKIFIFAVIDSQEINVS